MAYLNVRARRIEAKIAYVGAEHSGKHTNLAALGERCGVAVGEEATMVAFEIEPPRGGLDRTMLLRVVTHPGALVPGAVRDAIDDADGVVLVVDADAGAEARNREAVAALREGLGGRRVPVVVQVNKTDLPRALAPEDVARALAIEGWPLVPASAIGGGGVEATLTRVLDEVVRTMTAPSELHESDGGAARLADVRENPLLTALEDVLHASIAQQVRAANEDLARRFEPALERLDQRFEVLEAMQRELGDARRELATSITSTSGVLRRSLDAIHADVKRSATTEPVARLGATLRHVEEGMTRSFADLDGAVKELSDLTTTVASTLEQRLTHLESRVAELVEELKKPKKGWFG